MIINKLSKILILIYNFAFIICIIQQTLIFAQPFELKMTSQKFLFENLRNGIIHVGQKQEIPDKVSPKIKWLGTAFLVDDRCTFATAKHIFKSVNRDQIVVRFQLPQDMGKVRTLPARILFEHDLVDIAFLKIDYYNEKPCNSSRLHIFPIPSDLKLKNIVGELVYIIGYPRIAEINFDIPIIRSGIISSSEILWAGTPMLLIDLIGVPGFSGSPVILQRTSEVIGIVYGPGPTKRTSGFEWATPISKQDYYIAFEKTKTK